MCQLWFFALLKMPLSLSIWLVSASPSPSIVLWKDLWSCLPWQISRSLRLSWVLILSLPSFSICSSMFYKTTPLYYKRNNSTSNLDWPIPCYSSLYPQHLSQCLTHNRYQTNAIIGVSKNSSALITAFIASLKAQFCVCPTPPFSIPGISLAHNKWDSWFLQ